MEKEERRRGKENERTREGRRKDKERERMGVRGRKG